jgi:hypothetical protein
LEKDPRRRIVFKINSKLIWVWPGALISVTISNKKPGGARLN